MYSYSDIFRLIMTYPRIVVVNIFLCNTQFLGLSTLKGCDVLFFMSPVSLPDVSCTSFCGYDPMGANCKVYYVTSHLPAFRRDTGYETSTPQSPRACRYSVGAGIILSPSRPHRQLCRYFLISIPSPSSSLTLLDHHQSPLMTLFSPSSPPQAMAVALHRTFSLRNGAPHPMLISLCSVSPPSPSPTMAVVLLATATYFQRQRRSHSLLPPNLPSLFHCHPLEVTTSLGIDEDMVARVKLPPLRRQSLMYVGQTKE
ncbi:hypothetical protein VNO77_40343 [Canavalia gladiata]|uniref:Uncharacterized protein n=1 Tax=Canavalia gladiata TaxID=3824 RepID=A0AAN9JZR5_CANGL